jgi:PKD repeat protein
VQVQLRILCASLFLLALLWIAIFPVSAIVNGTIINQSATIYIGEQGLNVTHALNQAQGSPDIDGVPTLTTIAWWANETYIGFAAPTKPINLNTRYTSLTVAPSDFVGFTGNWYVLQNDGTNVTGLAFIVADPALDLRIWDFDHASDVTGTSVLQGTRLGFRIGTNMYGAVYNRSPIDPATDGFINIIVKNESSITFPALYNESTDAGSIAGPNSLLANFVNGQPWYWGSAITSWKTDARDSGTYIYPGGTYTAMAESTLNHMKDNYKDGGADYTGKTVSAIYTITLVSTPATGFTANITSGTAPLVVQFNDTSTNIPTSWNWSFGDGSLVDATVQDPIHTYATAGTYNVALNATNSAGSNTKTIVSYITVSSPVIAPVADFGGTPTSGTVPLTVTFMDYSTNSPTSWNWTFGDGSLVDATIEYPIHTYTTAGTYTVALNVTNSAGSNTKTIASYITVSSTVIAPVASFTGTPTTGTAPLAVTFTDTSTNTPTSWLWNFGDGSTSTLQNPSHTYMSAGTYSVSLNAANAGGSNTMTQAGYITITVPTTAPTQEPVNPNGGSDSNAPAPAQAPEPAQVPAPVLEPVQKQEVKEVPVLAQPQPVQQQPAPLAPQQIEPLAPAVPETKAVEGLAGVTVVESYPVGYTGLSYNTEGDNQVSIDISSATQAHATITTHLDNSVDVYTHGSPGVTITFYFDKYELKDNIITGTAKSAKFRTDPLTVNVSSGKIAGSVTAVLNSIKQPVKVENTITGDIPLATAEKYNALLAQDNQSLAGIAYLMKFQRGNLTSTGAANVTMTVPTSWVDLHGGKDAVRITRISDETGMTELLNTSYIGLDSENNMVFRGDSPHGTSLFGLVTAQATAAEKKAHPNETIIPAAKPAMITNVGMFGWLIGIITNNPVIILFLVAVIAAIAYFGWWKRRL